MSLCVKIWKIGCQCVVLTYFGLFSNGNFHYLPETKIDYLKFLITVISTKFVTCDTLWQLSYLLGWAWPSSNHSNIYFLRSWQKHCVRECGSSAKKRTCACSFYQEKSRKRQLRARKSNLFLIKPVIKIVWHRKRKQIILSSGYFINIIRRSIQVLYINKDVRGVGDIEQSRRVSSFNCSGCY